MQRKGSWSRLDLQEVMFILIKIRFGPACNIKNRFYLD